MSGVDPLRTSAVAAKLGVMGHRDRLLIFGAPSLLMVDYWLITEDGSAVLDWIVFAAAMVIGLVGIWLAPWRREAQLAATLAYVPIMDLAKGVSILFLECWTGNCL